MNPVYEKLLKCYDSFKSKIDFKPEIALVLGSGLGDYAESIDVVATLDYKDQPEGLLCPGGQWRNAGLWHAYQSL